ncbi:hypothetical protein [uncultured Neisseria sp.]|nr:hypothetical protein [uncultured Neisseria sp.]
MNLKQRGRLKTCKGFAKTSAASFMISASMSATQLAIECKATRSSENS